MFRAQLVFCLFMGLTGTASAVEKSPPKDAAAVMPVHPMYFGSMNSGLKVNDAYTEGNFSIVAPLWSTLGMDATLSGGMFFVEPYISWGEQGEVASSIGLGYRYLFGSQPFTALTKHDGHQAGFLEEGVIVGANVFADMLDTETDHRFWQLGVGAEVLTRYVELRGNYYIPLSDKKEVGSIRTSETFQSTSQQTSTFGGDPFATGNAIYQGYSQVTTQTTTTTTIERLFRQYEEGMEGWDIEIGVLIPWVDRYMDAKVIAGYYSFDNQPFGPQTGGAGNVEGWKAGLELRPVPALVVNSTWYEDERLTGSDWTLGVRMEIPFEAGNLGDGKNLWTRMADAFKPRRRHLVERIAEPVRRQNAAVKIAQSTEEDEEGQRTSVKKVTKVVSQSQGQLVLADDVVFVNNGPAVGNGIQAGSPTGTGTAESPVDTIQAGAAIAGPNSTATGRVWSVYTQGTTTNYTGEVGLSGNTNFIGSGMTIAGLSGKTFGKGTAPVLDGGFMANALGLTTMGLHGYVVNGGNSLGDGISATDLTSLRVIGNTFNGTTSDGIDIISTGATVASIYIGGNRFTVIGGDAIELDTLDTSVTSVLLTGNRFSRNTEDDIDVDASIDSELFFTATGNLFEFTTENAFNMESEMTSNVVFIATGNTFLNSGFESFFIDSNGASTFASIVSGNVFRDAFSDALSYGSSGTSTMSLTAVGNTFVNTFDDAIVFESFDTSTFNATIVGNFIADSGLGGLLGDVNDDSTLNLTATGNTITRMGAAGIDVSAVAATNAVINATLSGNKISFTDGPGVALGNLGGTSTMTATVSGNSIFGSFFDGILLGTASDTTSTFTVSGNSISSTLFTGISLLTTDTAGTTLTVRNNNIRLTGWEGIWVSATLAAEVDFTATGNVTHTTTLEGIHVDAHDDTIISVVANNNSISFAGDDSGGAPPGTFAGMALHTFDNGELTATSLAGNVIRSSANQGLEVKSEDTSVLNVLLFNGNTITGSAGDAIDLNAFAGTTLGFDGTANNSIGPSGTVRLNSTVDVTGTIIINGVPVVLPSVVP